MPLTFVLSHPGRRAADGGHFCRANCEIYRVEKDKRHFHDDSSAKSNNRAKVSESDCNKRYCDSINGKTEVRKKYKLGVVIADCETKSEIIEGGLDKRSSLDSLQQAVEFATVSNKKPVIVIYDTDGLEGKIEYRIKSAANKLGIEYRNVSCQ